MKIVLATLLLCTTLNASAEWTPVGTSAGQTIYLDSNRIFKRGGGITGLHMLIDLNYNQKAANGKSYLSTLATVEFDCSSYKTRALKLSHYSTQMGSGQEVYATEKADRWRGIEAGSMHDMLWKNICR